MASVIKKPETNPVKAKASLKVTQESAVTWLQPRLDQKTIVQLMSHLITHTVHSCCSATSTTEIAFTKAAYWAYPNGTFNIMINNQCTHIMCVTRRHTIVYAETQSHSSSHVGSNLALPLCHLLQSIPAVHLELSTA